MAFDSRADAGPIFRQLARTLAEAIGRGDIAIGARLPTEAELARRYGVGRQTVREAMADLRARGLITSRQGIGSIVLSNRAQQIFVETFSSIDELIRFGRAAPMRTLATEDIAADAALAATLRGREGQRYLRVTGTRPDPADPEGVPAGAVAVYIDAIHADIRADLPALKTSVAEAITARYGIEIVRIEQTIEAVALSARIAQILAAAPRTPTLRITRWYFDRNGRAFEIALTHFPAGRFTDYRTLIRQPARLGA